MFATVVKKWCFTFMWPKYCETREELKISKCLMLAYLHSRPVRNFLNANLRKIVHDFLVERVFIHDETFAMCTRMGVCHYEEATNSSHEGTNLGMKEHSAPVLSGSSVNFNTAMLNFQSDVKINEILRKSASTVESKRLYSSELPSSDTVTDLCHDLLVKDWQRKQDYHVGRAPIPYAPFTWFVVVKEQAVSSEKRRLHPVWPKNSDLINDFMY